MKTFIIDLDRCIGCHSCQLVCKDEHCDNDWMPYAAPQPDTGQFWMKVEEEERGKTPKVRVAYTPVFCQHCEDAPCMKAAKVGAVYRRDDGLVIIDPVKAKNQPQIKDACPYGAIYWNEELSIPQKCTGCALLLDDGWEIPRCVDACAHDALIFGEEEDLKDLLMQAEDMKSELGTKPQVHYLNMPKRFLAGEVADLEEEEVLIGAEVTITDLASGKKYTQTTDEFGDFWFWKIEPSDYSIDVVCDGYMPRHVVDFISTKDRDLNAGTIAMYKA